MQNIGKMHVHPTRNLCVFYNVEVHNKYMHYNRFKFYTKTVESFEQSNDYLHWQRDKGEVHADFFVLISVIV